MDRHAITVPELGLPEVPISVSLWLVTAGAAVVAGDRVVEILAGDVTVDLAAPIDGIVAAPLIGEETEVRAGDVLGFVHASADGILPSDPA